MDPVQIILLALVQALTEFLPVSSSGHLVLASLFFGWAYQGISFDLALHVGTLLAVLIYFRRDVWELGLAALGWRPGRPLAPRQRLAFGLALGTIPGAVAGALLGNSGALVLRHPLLIAAMLAGFGLLLGYAARRAPLPAGGEARDEVDQVFAGLSFGHAFLIGCAQALALVPGVSRSGATMTAALLLGWNRVAAARYAFLLSVPIMVGAGGYELAGLLASDEAVDWGAIALGTTIAAAAGLLVIHLFLGILRRIGVAPFVVYRVLLALVVVAWWFASRQAAVP